MLGFRRGRVFRIPHVPRAEQLVSFLSSPELVKVVVYVASDNENQGDSHQTPPDTPSTNFPEAASTAGPSTQGLRSTVVERHSKRKRWADLLALRHKEPGPLFNSGSKTTGGTEPVSAAGHPLHIDDATSATSQQDPPHTYYIHRNLLASRSPELHKHLYNAMKEGIEGVLVLHDVGEHVVERFVTWVYSKEYSHALPPETPFKDLLMLDVKIYVFGDRFNIQSLKKYALAKILLLLRQTFCRSQRDLKSFVEPLVDIIAYSFDNLPTSGLLQPLLDTETHIFSETGGDNLLRLWVQTVAWQLNMFRVLPTFDKLVDNQDLTKALFNRGVFRTTSSHITSHSQCAPWSVDIPYQLFNPKMAQQWGDATLSFEDYQLYGGGSDFVECGDSESNGTDFEAAI